MKETFIAGKVKTIFSTDKPDEVIIQYEDRVTAGNGKKELWVENKGRVCCEISSILFEELEKFGIKTHYLNIIPISIEKIIVINLIDLEIFLVLAFENQDKTSTKIIKIIIPKKIKFI